MASQENHIVTSISQRWHFEWKHCQAEEEITAKLSIFDSCLQILVCGCYDTHVDTYRGASANPVDHLLFDRTQQFALDREWQFANLIEKYGTFGREFKLPLTPIICAGERTTLVTKQLVFDQGLGNRRTVDRDEWLVASI
jgi:hypothetical protein